MLRKLRHWLKQDGNSCAKLAYLLNYKSGTTISNWVTRKSIPDYVKPRLKEILEKEL